MVTRRIFEMWERVYAKRGYNWREQQQLLIKKILELRAIEQDEKRDRFNQERSEEYNRKLIKEIEDKQNPIEKKNPSHRFSIRLKYDLWDLIKSNPNKMVRKAILKCYGDKK